MATESEQYLEAVIRQDLQEAKDELGNFMDWFNHSENQRQICQNYLLAPAFEAIEISHDVLSLKMAVTNLQTGVEKKVKSSLAMLRQIPNSGWAALEDEKLSFFRENVSLEDKVGKMRQLLSETEHEIPQASIYKKPAMCKMTECVTSLNDDKASLPEFHSLKASAVEKVREVQEHLPEHGELKYHNKLYMADMDRLGDFILAKITEKPVYMQAHAEKVEKMIEMAASTTEGGCYIPLVSLGKRKLSSKDDQQRVSLKFVLQRDANAHEVERRLRGKFEKVHQSNITKQFGTPVVHMCCDLPPEADTDGFWYTMYEENVLLIHPEDYGIENLDHPMRPEFNRYYTMKDEELEGFITTGDFTLYRGGEPYFHPTGWRRFGIDVGKDGSEFQDAYGEWPVVNHGTHGNLAKSILSEGLMAGDGLFQDELPAGKQAVYVSPSIKYCGHDRYAKVYRVKDKWLQMVLQIRVKPSAVTLKRPGTLLNCTKDDPPIDKNFKDNKTLTWLLQADYGSYLGRKDGVVIYGLMMRVTDEDPRTMKENQWWNEKN